MFYIGLEVYRCAWYVDVGLTGGHKASAEDARLLRDVREELSALQKEFQQQAPAVFSMVWAKKP